MNDFDKCIQVEEIYVLSIFSGTYFCYSLHLHLRKLLPALLQDNHN